MKPRIAIGWLGCKVSRFDAESVGRVLTGARFSVVPFDQDADVYLLFTCTVTHVSDRQSRQLIYRARRRSPQARILVTGCYAAAKPEELRALPEVDAVIPGTDKDAILQTLNAWLATDLNLPESAPVCGYGEKTRGLLKIQDGCNHRCAFCLVRFARPGLWSMPIADILHTLHRLAEHGYHEAVLTAVHAGCWGLDLDGKQRLVDLVRALEEESPIRRLRLPNLEPHLLDDDMVDILARSTAFCPHLHIPLQSGDNAVLKAMHRPYKVDGFVDHVRRLVQRRPAFGLGLDILVGFPGETDEQFECTYTLLETLPITYLHVFPFSPREGTEAASLPGALPPDVIKARAFRVRELAKSKRMEQWESYRGRRASVLVEPPKGQGIFPTGFTEHYLPVHFSEEVPVGELVNVEIVDVREDGLSARWINDKENEAIR